MSRLRRTLLAVPVLGQALRRSRSGWRRLQAASWFFYDLRSTWRAMHWRAGHRSRETLSAELLFQFHKLEKGLVMPGPHRLFGLDPARQVIALVERWEVAGHRREDPVYRAALEALQAYAARIDGDGLDPSGLVLPAVRQALALRPMRAPALATPQRLPALPPEVDGPAFHALAEARRSVRSFRPETVPATVVEQAVRSAQLAPSACNRQPCRLLVVSAPEDRRRLLAWQNGNRGFGQSAPHVAILTSDERCFFDASERHEPYIDGGLFAMGFVLALRAQGVASCCLNWCVPPQNDRAVHRLFDLASEERIVMLIAFGLPGEDCEVPRSARRRLDEVLRIHRP